MAHTWTHNDWKHNDWAHNDWTHNTWMHNTWTHNTWTHNDWDINNEYCVKEYVSDYDVNKYNKYNKYDTAALCPTMQEQLGDEYVELIYWLEIKKHDMTKTCDSCFDYIFKCSD